MGKAIRIGTRDSELALWQAHTVEKKLNDLGYATEIVAVKSTGDLILDKPLYELGITGIFTKTLDIAMIHGQIDIAVHSMKDVPTVMPIGIVQAAVLERASEKDILVYKNNLDFFDAEGVVASGSLRRQAQWRHRYSRHTLVDLRGDVNTRLQKLVDNEWDGAIFAEAGLERLGLRPENSIDLDWMVPAPAQGAMVVVAMEHDAYSREALAQLNHKETEVCTHIERQFLKTLEGGCTAPIGAFAVIKNNEIHFVGNLFSIDGRKKLEIERNVSLDHWDDFGRVCAEEILENGGAALMKSIKDTLKNPF